MVDSNGDGIADAMGYDTTGDGWVDALDVNGDGVIDEVVKSTLKAPVRAPVSGGVNFDSNGDGVDNAIGYDTNGDGFVDSVDVNQDGVIDKLVAPGSALAKKKAPRRAPLSGGVLLDTTGDGKVDAIGYDTTGDGQIDAVDTTMDGLINETVRSRAAAPIRAPLRAGVMLDTTGDGIANALGYDTTGDGLVDAIDHNMDGLIDEVINIEVNEMEPAASSRPVTPRPRSASVNSADGSSSPVVSKSTFQIDKAKLLEKEKTSDDEEYHQV